MNVYDFDNTIYDGESVIDFYFFLMRKHIRLAAMLPKMIRMLVRYKRCLISVDEMIEAASKYSRRMIEEFGEIDGIVEEFWDKNEHKIKKFYLKNKKDDDVILSASSDFMLNEICRRIGVKNLLCSHMDEKTGEITRLCFHKNKVDIFKEAFPDTRIDEFYTDSMNDRPMFELAKRVYLVKGNVIKEVHI